MLLGAGALTVLDRSSVADGAEPGLSREQEEISVKDVRFGAIGDGKHDDTEAFRRLRDFFKSQSLGVTSYSADGYLKYLARYRVRIPAGVYVISEAAALFDRVPETLYGLIIEGDGPGATQIHYKPAIDGPLVNCFNRLYGFTVRNITFKGFSEDSDFMTATSHGTMQDGVFERCEWTGAWRDLFVLDSTGEGNNSEILWRKCTFSGAIRTILSTNTSDQLVNYWFEFCKVWCTTTWIRADAGGYFYLSGCDVSVYGLRHFWKDRSEVVLFELTGRGRPTQQFLITSTRVECHSSSAKILRSCWESGRIIFEHCGFERQGGYKDSSDMFDFDAGRQDLFVLVQGCSLTGNTKVRWTSPDARDRPAAASHGTFLFRECIHHHLARPDDFIVYEAGTDFEDVNGGGVPVKFIDCGTRVTWENTVLVWNCCTGASYADLAQLRELKLVLTPSERNYSSDGSTATWRLFFPRGTILTTVDVMSASRDGFAGSATVEAQENVLLRLSSPKLEDNQRSGLSRVTPLEPGADTLPIYVRLRIAGQLRDHARVVVMVGYVG